MKIGHPLMKKEEGEGDVKVKQESGPPSRGKMRGGSWETPSMTEDYRGNDSALRGDSGIKRGGGRLVMDNRLPAAKTELRDGVCQAHSSVHVSRINLQPVAAAGNQGHATPPMPPTDQASDVPGPTSGHSNPRERLPTSAAQVFGEQRHAAETSHPPRDPSNR